MLKQQTATYSPNRAELTKTVQYVGNEIIQKWIRSANTQTRMVNELIIELLPTGEVISIGLSYLDASATDTLYLSL